MGLASGIHWPHAPSFLTTRVAAESPLTQSATLTELLTINDEYCGALMLRVCAVVIFVFQTAYFLNELNSANSRPATAGLHLFNIGVTCLAFGISFSPRLVRYWRGIVLATCWAVLGGTAAINAIRHEDIPLFIVVLLFSTGTGCLIPWSERWQAALNVFALASFAIVAALMSHDPFIYFRWLAILTGVAIAQLAAHLTALYR